jgi:hypothetical protein
MKLITGSEDAVNDNLCLQFNFGARLVAYPRLDRWDEEGKRLQSIGSDGKLMDAWTYHWQRAKEQGGTFVAGHIEDAGFNPSPMVDLYPPEMFEEGFLEEYGHLSSTEYVTQEIIDKDENITTITTT